MNAHDDDTMKRARRRVARVRGFWINAIQYVAVNTLLVVVDLAAGRGSDTVAGLDWAYWPVIFWGVFLVADAISTFVVPALFDDRWFERRLERYLPHQQH